ncbi:MAG: hypothetical protein HC802_11050, partial [Caldilineaceae bacterium]|nr:hypothetical protein [Caldilineaceae bacterium]
MPDNYVYNAKPCCTDDAHRRLRILAHTIDRAKNGGCDTKLFQRSFGFAMKLRAILGIMELEIAVDSQTKRHRRPWLEVTLVTGFIVSLLVGIAALLVLFLVQGNQESAAFALNPLSTVLPEKISPALALTQLQGDPAEALALQATNAGELETAYAIVLFDTQLEGSARIGVLSQLARRFRSAAQFDRAAQVYRLMAPAAILDATLSSMEGAQSLTEVAEGLLLAEEHSAALDYADQAKRIATQAPELLPALRSQLFNALRPLANNLGDPRFAQEIDELARNPYLAPANFLIDSKWETLADPVAPDPTLDAAISTRQMAARQLAERLALTGGVDVEPEQKALETALITEDQARAAFF